MADAPETGPETETLPPPEQPPRPRSPRARRAALAILALMLAGLAWAVSRPSPWQSGIAVESYRATVGRSKLELCASGHFDQGLLGELLHSMGAQATDMGVDDCVGLLFEEALTPGTYRVVGRGQWRVVSQGEPATFTPREDHAPELKSVWIDRGCFCSPGVSEVGFDGTLTLTALDPPTGRLSLEVRGDGEDASAWIDVPLRSFEWAHRDGNRSLSDFAAPSP